MERYVTTLFTIMSACIDIHSNKKLQEELEDLQIEEASLRYQINLLLENYNVIKQ